MGLHASLTRKMTLFRRQLTEPPVSRSVTSLVDISVDNISLDTLAENRITSASAIGTCAAASDLWQRTGPRPGTALYVTPQPGQIFE